MAGHSGGQLAAAVYRGGGIGFIGAGHWLADDDSKGLQMLEREISLFHAATSATRIRKNSTMGCHDAEATDDDAGATPAPFGIGFLCYSSLATKAGWKRLAHVLETHQPSCVQFFAPAVMTMPEESSSATSNIAFTKQVSPSTIVFAQVGTVRDALAAQNAGADVIIAQGTGAGGHGLRRGGSGTLSLARNCIAEVDDIPVIAAGGIVDGPTMAAAMVLGCDGVVLGTRLWASRESLGLASLQQRLAAPGLSCDDVVRTSTFDWIQNAYHTYPWPDPYDSVGGLRNATSREWEGRPERQLQAAIAENHDNMVDRYRTANERGDPDIGLVHCGEGVGLIDSVDESAEVLVRDIAEDCAKVLRGAHGLLLEGDL